MLMKNNAGQHPVRVGPAFTLSNKKYGIAVYYLLPEDSHFKWQHLMNRWYKREVDMLKALRDLCLNENSYRWKFVPFKNNFKTMPQDQIILPKLRK